MTAEASEMVTVPRAELDALRPEVRRLWLEVGRSVAAKLLRGKLKIDGLLPNIMTLNAVTRIFSVQ